MAVSEIWLEVSGIVLNGLVAVLGVFFIVDICALPKPDIPRHFI